MKSDKVLISRIKNHIFQETANRLTENSKNKNYYYFIDLDERGYFSAHVEDASGKIVFEFSNDDSEDGAIWLIEDGFMKHTKDVEGLEDYLHHVDMIPRTSHVYDGNKTTWRGARLGESADHVGDFNVSFDFPAAQYDNIPDTLQYHIKDLVIETPEGNVTVPDGGSLSLNLDAGEFLEQLVQETNADITKVDTIKLQNPPQKMRYNFQNNIDEITSNYTVTVVYTDSAGDAKQVDIDLNDSTFTPSPEFKRHLDSLT